jgi:hypothetical protein
MTAYDDSTASDRATEGGSPRRGPGDRVPPEPSSNGHDPVGEVRAAMSNLGEVGVYAQQFINAKIAGILYGFRKLALLSMLGAVVGIAGISILVTCAVLLVMGIADGIAQLLPDHLDWLGPLLVGLGGILLSAVAVYIVLRRAAAVGKRMALEQYRSALHDQRKEFGHDAFSRSAAYAASADLAARRAPARTREEIQELREKQTAAEKAQRQVQEDFQRIKGE